MTDPFEELGRRVHAADLKAIDEVLIAGAGLSVEKLVRAKAILDAANVPLEGRIMPFPVPSTLFGPPPQRRNRYPRKPLAQWREKLARMEHKAQWRRWRANPEVQSKWAAMRKALEAGQVVEFMGFKFIDRPGMLPV